jgi:hypothetical protein
VGNCKASLSELVTTILIYVYSIEHICMLNIFDLTIISTRVRGSRCESTSAIVAPNYCSLPVLRMRLTGRALSRGKH